MNSPSINRYRIKKKYTVDDDGYQKEYYYPQYNSKLFGWRNMIQEYSCDNTNQTLFPDMAMGPIVGGVILIFTFIVGFVLLLNGVILASLILLTTSPILLWLVVYITNRITTEDDGLKRYSSKEKAKKFITKRINAINGKTVEKRSVKKRSHITHDTLPDDEVFYLDVKSERLAKLKKIKRSKWKLW